MSGHGNRVRAHGQSCVARRSGFVFQFRQPTRVAAFTRICAAGRSVASHAIEIPVPVGKCVERVGVDLRSLQHSGFRIEIQLSQRAGRVVGVLPGVGIVGNGHDYVARGRALMVLQDRWPGEIVKPLAQHGKSGKTVIVVTADHGIHTRNEDPHFQGWNDP